ncbi:MAG: ComF family protein, partial [Clostridia bacterium]|nr:ComF family protein [Clostridia bacterium]
MTLLDLLFPPTCPGCGTVLEHGEAMCPACQKTARRNGSPHCAYCGVSLRDCRCAKQARPYDRVVSPFYYEGSVRDAILRMKFAKREEGARFLAAELKKEIEARYFGETFDLITAVPLSRARYAERGFNQARTLAELLMEDPPAPLRHALQDYGLLTRIGSGQEQHFLGAEARRQNIRGNVRVGKGRDLTGKRILLIDDIVT